MKQCFKTFHLDFSSVEHHEFEAMFDSLCVDGENDVSLASFKKHIFRSQREKKRHLKKKKDKKKRKRQQKKEAKAAAASKVVPIATVSSSSDEEEKNDY